MHRFNQSSRGEASTSMVSRSRCLDKCTVVSSLSRLPSHVLWRECQVVPGKGCVGYSDAPSTGAFAHTFVVIAWEVRSKQTLVCISKYP